MMDTKTILIVEDEKIISEDLKEILTDLDYKVNGCVSAGQEAIDFLETEKGVDLVLMDIKLHGKMDGVEAAEIIKRRFLVPIIYLTAFADDAILSRAKATEPFGYLVKPYRPSEIKSAIEVALFKSQIEKKLKDAYDELEIKVTQRTARLEEMNTALKILIEYRENEKKELIQNFSKNLNARVFPHFDTIRIKWPNKELKAILDTVTQTLEEISQPFEKIISEDMDLTPTELRVVDLIRQGRTSKEIANLMGITVRGVVFHRGNIRKKIGIRNRKKNLKAALIKIV